MRISDWSSDVCSSDLLDLFLVVLHQETGGVELRHHEVAQHHGGLVGGWAVADLIGTLHENDRHALGGGTGTIHDFDQANALLSQRLDRKSTRLNSSH